MHTKIKLAAVAMSLFISATAAPTFAQVTVGGAPMYASKDIIDNAVN